MDEKMIEAIAQMWATHPDAATLSLHWATVEQQLASEDNREMLHVARTIRDRAAEAMKLKREPQLADRGVSQTVRQTMHGPS